MSGPWGVRLSLIDVGEVWPLRQTRTLAPTTGPGKMAPGVIRQMDELSLRPIQAAHEKQGRHTEPPPPPALTEAQRGNRWRAGGRVGGLLWDWFLCAALETYIPARGDWQLAGGVWSSRVSGPSPSLIFRSQPKSMCFPEPTHTTHPTKGSSPPSPCWSLTVSEEGGLQSGVRARPHPGCSECPSVPTLHCASFLCPPP